MKILSCCRRAGAPGRLCGLFVLVAAGARADATNVFEPVQSVKTCYYAKSLLIPQKENTKTFACAEKMGGFTYFSPGVENPRVEDGVLKFRMNADEVLLGWGNYGGKQPLKERQSLWWLYNNARLRVKQSTPEATTWVAEIWRDGKRAQYNDNPVHRSTNAFHAVLTGTDWQELDFRGTMRHFTPDGFDFTIKGKKGTEIAIEWAKIYQPCVEGYFRKEIELPPGKIWRAVLNASDSTEIWVNGRHVDRNNGLRVKQPEYAWWTSPIDIGPYLEAGKKNCIGFHGFRPGPTSGHAPFFYLQGRLVMDSGAIVPVDTDDSWLYSVNEVKDWSQPGTPAGAWQKPRTGIPAYSMMGMPPGYSGPVVLENPDYKQLFYDRPEKPIRVKVRMPAGYAAQKPLIHYRLFQETVTWTERWEQDVKVLDTGRVSEFKQAGDSAEGLIDLGPRERGVYSLAVSLELNGQIVERCAREPIMVSGRLPQKEIEGTSYTEGLDLELEDTFDFTDPKDPHPWVESLGGLRGGYDRPAPAEPRIVTRGKIRYRETHGQERSAAILYGFRFKHPGDLYLVEISYPNDAMRFIGVSVSTPGPWEEKDGKKNKEAGRYCTEAGVQIITGHKFPVSETLQTFRFLVLAEQGWHSLDIVNGLQNTPAAAAGAKLYHIKGLLPALKTSERSERLVGIHTERTMLGSGFARTLGSGDLYDLGADGKRVTPGADTDPMTAAISRLILNQQACENYAQYLRFTGQNVHVMGVYQYSDVNTPYTPPVRYQTSRLSTCMKSTLAEVLRVNGIRFMTGIEFGSQRALQQLPFAERTDAEVAAGADTIWFVDRNGKQLVAAGLAGTPNFFHPAIRQAYGAIIDDMIALFGDNSAFLGVHHCIYPDDLFLPFFPVNGNDCFFTTYDDVTFTAFEKETGLKVPAAKDAPDRFRKRYEFVMQAEVKPRWIEFRCQMVRRFLLEGRDRLRQVNPDWRFAAMLFMDVPHLQRWLESGLSYHDFLRQYGQDPALYRNDENFYYGRWMIGPELHHALRYDGEIGGKLKRDNYAAYWNQHVGAEVLDLYARKDNRAVFIMNQWDEVGYASPSNTSATLEWVLNSSAGRFTPLAGGDDYKETWAQAMIGADPDLLIYGFTDTILNGGNEQAVREYTRVLTRLPKDRFTPFGETGFQSNLALRELRKDGKYYFYAVNPGYWPIRGTVRMKGDHPVYDLVTGKKAGPESGQAVRVELSPWGIAAFRADSDKAGIASWETDPVPDPEQAHVRAMIDRTTNLLENRQVAAGLSDADRRFLDEQVRAAQASLQRGRIAESWSQATDWRGWIVNDAALTFKKYMAFLPPVGGSKPSLPPAGEAKPVLRIVRIHEKPKMDGRLDDPVWQTAPEHRGFVTPQNRPAIMETSVRAAYDADAVYLGFQCADPVPGKIEAANAGAFSFAQDAIALFLQPDETQNVYYQLAFNAAGKQFNQQVMGEAKDYQYRANWEVATARTDFGWTAEVMLKFDSFPLITERKTGRWLVNVFRSFRAGGPQACFSYAPAGWHDLSAFAPTQFDPS